MKITVKKTTYEVEGGKEKCFEVSNGCGTMVRIAKYYHIIGKDTVIVVEYLDGHFNSQDELDEDFDTLTKADAKEIAMEFSCYL